VPLKIITTHLIELMYIAPEICLVFAILHCLLQLSFKSPIITYEHFLLSSKVDPLPVVVIKTTFNYLQIAILLISCFLLHISLESYRVAIVEDGND